MRFNKIEIGAAGFRLNDDGLKFRQIAGVPQFVVQIINGKTKSIGNGGQILFDEFRVIAEKQDAKGRAIIDEDAKMKITPTLPPQVPFGSHQWPALITPGPGAKTLADLP